MVRIINANINGIRSAWSKGFHLWLAEQNADIVCLQELKALKDDLPCDAVNPAGWHAYYCFAQKKGYSGVGLWSRKLPDQVVYGFGVDEFDAEGRYVRADWERLSVISVYVPSGSSSEERQAAKFRFLDAFLPHLLSLRANGRELIVCGDWNIAHQNIDLKNWRSNQKNSGFLPEERAWLTRLLAEAGLVDVFRQIDTQPEQYTWWSNRGQAWAKNVGWRLDYQLATPETAGLAKAVSIYKERRFSDHAPLAIDYQLSV